MENGKLFRTTLRYAQVFVIYTYSKYVSFVKTVFSVADQEAKTVLTVRNLMAEKELTPEIQIFNISWDPPFGRCNAALHYHIRYEFYNDKLEKSEVNIVRIPISFTLNLFITEMSASSITT